MPKKVLLVVIDAATPRIVCPSIHTSALPTLRRLVDAGTLHEGSVTIFPSITPAATTTIITGEYPAVHGIAGASWFDEARNEVAYYGDDFWVVAREGFGAFLRDFLVRLNGDRLRVPTLFETIEGAGRQAACLNYLVFRGLTEHEAQVPRLLRFLPGVPERERILGPSALSLGDFVSSRAPHGKRLESSGGILHRFGMDDAATGQLLCDLVAEDGLPDFTVAYFPDNDYRSHEVGPSEALPVIERIDGTLAKVFEAAGGMDRFLERVCLVLTSDHGHCEIRDSAADAVILLDDLLGGFRPAKLGKPWGDEDQLMVCPNMRAAQIYLHQPTPSRVAEVSRALLADARVDQVLWCADLENRGDGYVIESRRGQLHVRRADGSGAGVVRDAYGTRWRCEGELRALGLDRYGDEVASSEYPNALERIAGVLESERSGEIWVTARPGCEFEVPGGKAHVGGGSHGALHALDSYCPVLLAGAPDGVGLPREMRSVDIAPICLEVLGLPSPYRPGDARLHQPRAAGAGRR